MRPPKLGKCQVWGLCARSVSSPLIRPPVMSIGRSIKRSTKGACKLLPWMATWKIKFDIFIRICMKFIVMWYLIKHVNLKSSKFLVWATAVLHYQSLFNPTIMMTSLFLGTSSNKPLISNIVVKFSAWRSASYRPPYSTEGQGRWEVELYIPADPVIYRQPWGPSRWASPANAHQ